ncbi:hypothetical protein AB1N83_002112 [Pleurotus pulmonarius]
MGDQPFVTARVSVRTCVYALHLAVHEGNHRNSDTSIEFLSLEVTAHFQFDFSPIIPSIRVYEVSYRSITWGRFRKTSLSLGALYGPSIILLIGINRRSFVLIPLLPCTGLDSGSKFRRFRRENPDGELATEWNRWRTTLSYMGSSRSDT